MINQNDNNQNCANTHKTFSAQYFDQNEILNEFGKRNFHQFSAFARRNNNFNVATLIYRISSSHASVTTGK